MNQDPSISTEKENILKQTAMYYVLYFVAVLYTVF